MSCFSCPRAPDLLWFALPIEQVQDLCGSILGSPLRPLTHSTHSHPHIGPEVTVVMELTTEDPP